MNPEANKNKNSLNSPIEAQCTKTKGLRAPLLFIHGIQLTKGNFCMFSLLFQQFLIKFCPKTGQMPG